MTCFAVVWTTQDFRTNFDFFSFHLKTTLPNLIPGCFAFFCPCSTRIALACLVRTCFYSHNYLSEKCVRSYLQKINSRLLFTKAEMHKKPLRNTFAKFIIAVLEITVGHRTLSNQILKNSHNDRTG